MATSYSWNLFNPTVTGSLPNPGSYVPSSPTFASSRVSEQSQRGIRFANVPLGRADLVVHGGPRVWHVNSVQLFQEGPATINRSGTYSGVIKFRFRNYRSFPIPSSVNPVEHRSVDQFGNPVFDFTGRF